METTKEFLAKLSKINFDKAHSKTEFSGQVYMVKFSDKISSDGACILIHVQVNGKTVKTWGAWDADAFEVAAWREKLYAKIDKSEFEREQIEATIAKGIFDKL